MRRFFFALLAAVALNASTTAPAAAQRVIVDTSPLAGKAAPRYAALIRAELPPRLQKKIAGKFRGTVTVRIRNLQMASFGSPFRVDPTDYLEGDVIVAGREPKPILLSLPFDRSPALYTPVGEAQRLYFLIEYFADWAAKAL